MTRARSSSAGQAAPVPTPSGDEGPPQHPDDEVLAYLADLHAKTSWIPSRWVGAARKATAFFDGRARAERCAAAVAEQGSGNGAEGSAHKAVL